MNEKKKIIKPDKVDNLALYVPKLNKEISLKIFDKIVPGDVVYAPTTKIKKKLTALGDDHRIRPHYVVKKEGDVLITYTGTSDLSYKMEDFVFMDLSKYGLKKGGNVDIGRYKYIRDSEIVNYFCHLKPKDICKFNKKILETKFKDERNGVKKDHLMFAYPMDELSIGTIVCLGNILYCVYDISVSHIILCELKEDVTNSVFVIDGKIYSIDFKKKRTVQKKVNQTVFTLQIPSAKALNKIEKEKEDTNFEFCLKKSKDDKREYIFKYPIGQIFIKESNNREFVYLFSVLDEDYGIEILPKEKLSKIRPFPTNLKRKKVLKEEEIDDILRQVSSHYPDFIWLRNHVDTVRKQAKQAQNRRYNIEEFTQTELGNEVNLNVVL